MAYLYNIKRSGVIFKKTYIIGENIEVEAKILKEKYYRSIVVFFNKIEKYDLEMLKNKKDKEKDEEILERFLNIHDKKYSIETIKNDELKRIELKTSYFKYLTNYIYNNSNIIIAGDIIEFYKYIDLKNSSIYICSYSIINKIKRLRENKELNKKNFEYIIETKRMYNDLLSRIYNQEVYIDKKLNNIIIELKNI